jgi:hypothetical protein
MMAPLVQELHEVSRKSGILPEPRGQIRLMIRSGTDRDKACIGRAADPAFLSGTSFDIILSGAGCGLFHVGLALLRAPARMAVAYL